RDRCHTALSSLRRGGAGLPSVRSTPPSLRSSRNRDPVPEISRLQAARRPAARELRPQSRSRIEEGQLIQSRDGAVQEEASSISNLLGSSWEERTSGSWRGKNPDN